MSKKKIEVRKAKKSLKKKGFEEAPSRRGHKYYWLYFNGKRTACYTYFSHSPKVKIVDAKILHNMVKQLRLDSNEQVVDLLECPMTREKYITTLRMKGELPD